MEDPNTDKRVTVVGIRSCLEVVCPDLDDLSSVEYIGRLDTGRMQLALARQHLLGLWGTAPFCSRHHVNIGQAVLPEPRVEGLGPLERRPGRRGMQPNIEILNAPAPQQGSTGKAITAREREACVRPGAHTLQAVPLP